VDIGGCRTSSDGDDGGYMYHLHLGVIRVCAIRSVACAGRRRRQRWRLTHLAATVVDILARTDQQGRTYTLRATVDANLAVRSPRLDCRRWEESAVERGSRVGSRRRVAKNLFDSLLDHEKGVASLCASTTTAIFDGDCRRAWLATPRVERGLKRGGKLALIEAGDSPHAHPGGSCKRSTAVKEKETKSKEGKRERSKGRGE